MQTDCGLIGLVLVQTPAACSAAPVGSPVACSLRVKLSDNLLQAALDEIVSLGGAWLLPGGQIRRHLLLLQRHVQDMLERGPPS